MAKFKRVLGKNIKEKLNKMIPIFAVPSLLFIIIYNQFIYTGTQFLMKNAHHYNLTMGIDKCVPFSSWWITIYLGCYVFWVLNYILIARQGKDKWYRFLTSDLLSKAICGVIFILLPTTINRPEIVGNSIFDKLTKAMYSMDMPTNLFPSIHCLASWLCYVGIRKDKNIPKWYKVFSCVFALLVCASTQFTKQHYVLDIVGGIAIAEFTYWLAQKTTIYMFIMKLFEKINKKLFKINFNRMNETEKIKNKRAS